MGVRQHMTKEKRIKEMLLTVQKEHGNNNKLVHIPELMAKKLLGYCTMKFDLELINEFSKILSKNINNHIGSSATYSIIALYGKCFTKSDDGYPKLEAKEIFKNNSKLEKEHKYLMDLRNRFIAHRTQHIDELGIAFLVINKDSKRTELRYSLQKMSVISPRKMEKLQTLFKHVHEEIIQKLFKSGDRTYEGVLKKYTSEQLEEFRFDK